MEDIEVNEELDKNNQPVYISIVIFLLKIVFFVYDLIVFIPFKIWADPSQKLRMSQRSKASPVKDGDPASPWRNNNVKEGELATCVFEGCHTLAEQWNESVRYE
ncbi:unnamed protein product [Haemonchus placei]|uniref:Transmembrane protein n=1 Tax=Haemonchus placei TaxID=6290 RepID=A0A0N4WDZ5_HAEPC|nr:unnamed protein product [Haemonchus placei]